MNLLILLIQALREASYPFLAVVVLRQGRMMVVARVEGDPGAEELSLRLSSAVRDNEAYVVAARADREERSRNQSIREEQDAAFAETLRQDQEKERKRKEEEEAKRAAEEAELAAVRAVEERKEAIKRLRQGLIVAPEPEREDENALRLLVRLPDGRRLERRFSKSQPLSDLYKFVFAQEDAPDHFEVTSNFPKRTFRCRPAELDVDGDDPEGSEEADVSFGEAGVQDCTAFLVIDLEA